MLIDGMEVWCNRLSVVMDVIGLSAATVWQIKSDQGLAYGIRQQMKTLPVWDRSQESGADQGNKSTLINQGQGLKKFRVDTHQIASVNAWRCDSN